MSSTSLNTHAMMKAAGIGAGVIFIIVLLNQVVGAATMMNYYSNPSSDTSLLLGVSGLAICFSCASYLFFGAVGAMYGWFDQRDEGTVEIGMTALGGAITAAITGIFYGIVGMIFNMIAALFLYPMLMPDQDAASAIFAGGFSLVTSLVSGLGWTCAAVLIGALLGAIGGAVYAAVAGNRAPNASPGMGV